MIEALLSGLLWRLRGIVGWPGTLAFASVQVWTLWHVVGEYSLIYGLWIMLGEPTGWKPKKIWDSGDWKGSALYGLRIGLIGGIAVPLSTWLQREFGEPRIKALENPKAFKLPFWDSYKFLLDWRGAWNEVYFGIIFSLLVQVLAGAFYGISF